MPTDSKTYLPAEAAALLGVHVNSVRSWTVEFAEVLSQGAQARPRILSSGDVAALQVIRDLRRAGLPSPEIVARILQMPPADLQEPSIPGSSSPQEPPGEAQGGLEVITYRVALENALQARILALEGKQAEIDRKQARLEERREWITWLLVALVVGLALGLLIGLSLR